MSNEQRTRTHTRDRTRAAVLSAAATVWARNRGATLAEIADAAGVGRSTVHRYFSNREQLLDATVEDSARTIDLAIADAELDYGPPRAALRRLVIALVEVGDRIMFLFGDPEAIERLQRSDYSDKTDDPVISLIQRGQSSGVFDRESSPEWIQHVLWALVYTGFEMVKSGVLLRHDIVERVLRTFESGILQQNHI